ncbi:putative 18S rRNA (guanine-N(7))-methyltransferase [Trichoplax sp. H2]|nr:putative 18S rRNA (guanine-N(7))-methyltransferase [Trichoplax sp. H2]|eukprot:RDD37186.1 putative 18S rRNA (guanine-N(7))-methyltransferase [Trichoplax sp. H2]
MPRPEHGGPPELYYNERESTKYTNNSRVIDVQFRMSERAMELLSLPSGQPSLILDVGCGSGLSGEIISEMGHFWIGLDISKAMLDVAAWREVNGDLFLQDMGDGIGFRPGTFDGVISISAIQWLCNANKKHHRPAHRLYRFFCSLYIAMARGARAVFQLYPENSEQLELITTAAMKAGFTGGITVDYPNSTRAKKMFLCLFTGQTAAAQLPQGLDTTFSPIANVVQFTNERFSGSKNKLAAPAHARKKSRDWILHKKQRRRRQGFEIRADSKYTGRRRKHKF